MRIVSTTTLLLAVLLVPAFGQGVPVAAAPETSVQLGRVPAFGPPVTHDFILRNEGTAPLEILEVEKVCDCASYHIGAMSLPPGGETTVTVVVDPRGKRGEFAEGIRLRTNDPERLFLLFAIRGEAFEKIQAEPDRIDFGIVPAAYVPTLELGIVVEINDPDVEALAGVTPSTPVLACRMQPLGGKRYQLLVTLHPGPPDAMVEGDLRLDFTGATPQILRIPIRGLVQNAIEPSLRLLRLTGFLERTPMSQTVYLTHRESFQVVRVEAPEWINAFVSALPARSGRPGSTVVKVVLTLDPARLGAVAPVSTIRLVTDCPEAPQVLLSLFDDRPPPGQ